MLDDDFSKWMRNGCTCGKLAVEDNCKACTDGLAQQVQSYDQWHAYECAHELDTENRHWEHIDVSESGKRPFSVKAEDDRFASIVEPGEIAPSATNLSAICTLLDKVQRDPAKYVQSSYLPLPDCLDKPVMYAVSLAAPKPLWEKGGAGGHKSRSGPQLNLKLHGCQKRHRRINVGEVDSGQDISVSFFTTSVCEIGRPLSKDDQITWQKGDVRVQSRVKDVRDDLVVLDNPSWMHRVDSDSEISCSCDKCESRRKNKLNATGIFKVRDVVPIEAWHEGKQFVLVHQSKTMKSRLHAKTCKRKRSQTVKVASPQSTPCYDNKVTCTRADALLNNMKGTLAEFQQAIYQLSPGDREAQLTALHKVVEDALQISAVLLTS